MKKTIFVLLVLAIAVALLAAAPAYTRLSRLSVWNRTDKDVKLLLTYTGATPAADLHYYLTARPADVASVFTIERQEYKLTYWACGGKASGSLDARVDVHLTFTSCDAVYVDSHITDLLTGSRYARWYWVKYIGGPVLSYGKIVFYHGNYMNEGEPSMEKVHIKQTPITPSVKSPWGSAYRLQY